MDSGFVKTFNYFDLSALGSLKAEAVDKKDESLRIVAQQLESVFLELVLKSMNEANASIKSEIFDRDQEEFYQDMFNQQLALSLSKAGGLGLSEVIYQQLKPQDTTDMPMRQLNIERQGMPITLPKQADILPQQPNTSVLVDNAKESITVKPLTESEKAVKEFMDSLLPHAELASKIIGLDPKLLLAQSALETGWGKHILHDENGQSSHNLFGVKSNDKWEGKAILAQTLEYTDDQAKEIKAPFKSYNSYLESFLDYISLLKNKRYEKALENKDDPKTFLSELHQAGYATDPKYVDKILKIYEKFATFD